MMDKPMVTLDRLKELLSYDPATGVFVWRTQRKGKGKIGTRAGRIMAKTGYRNITVDGVQYFANRLAWFWVHGVWPGRVVIKNEDRDDARIGNLEGRDVLVSGAKSPGEYLRLRKGQDPMAHRKYVIKRYGGMLLSEYQAMFVAQQGVCAVCSLPETAMKKMQSSWLSVDHNHATGAVRGLLCHACNMAIGAFKDDAALLRKAADYLDHHAAHPNVIPLRSNA